MIARLLKKIVLVASLAGVVAFAALPLATSTAEAQSAAPAAAGAATKPAAEGKIEKSLWQELKQGGVVMVILGIGSVLVIWFGVDCIIKTTRMRAIPVLQLAQFKEYFKAGDYTNAFTFAKGNYSPLCDIVRAGVTFLPDGKTMTEEAMFNEINRINGALMGRVSYLSVIGVCAPMVGLLGTVNGMRSAFGALASSGAGDTAALSEAIGEVLIATAAGLFVAIPAFVLYYVLRNRISGMLHDLQEEAAKLFRKMPYKDFDGFQLGDDEIIANRPSWVTDDGTTDNAEQPIAG
ncbi:MAG: MotA/TolQ/ExbB proton channel family protein [Puniceicoccales bacterium]|jgi:biopolymer transport protein ExbB|nr:MotA/TolQ/ExbB proton channel family protein [Puniceicoccales bacterium]